MIEFTMRPLQEAERKYTYRQSEQLTGQCGSIGYLRGDFGKNGEDFYTTWFEQRKSRNTAVFKSSFDNMVNILRNNGGLLQNRKATKAICDTHNTAAGFQDDLNRRQYGFRVDCGEYVYLIRCNPTVTDDYNFCIFAHEKTWLDRNIEQAAKGIRFITSDYKTLFMLQDGDKISVTRDGIAREYICRYIDETHLEVGSELYHICQFAEIMERNGSSYVPLAPFIKTLPPACYASLAPSGELVVIKNGCHGYQPCAENSTNRAENTALMDKLNAKLGVNKAEVAAMLHGSLFGWHTPGADPARYDETGNTKKKLARETER